MKPPISRIAARSSPSWPPDVVKKGYSISDEYAQLSSHGSFRLRGERENTEDT